LPILLEQNEGHIINTASLAGLGGVPGLGTYCASKFAVVGLSESLHHELSMLGSAVRVSVLCPGFVRTRIHESDRNMPADVAAVADTPGALLMADLAKAAVEAGISVDVVAEAVYSAVVEERFYVLTHQQAATGTTEARIAWMVDGQPPVMTSKRSRSPSEHRHGDLSNFLGPPHRRQGRPARINGCHERSEPSMDREKLNVYDPQRRDRARRRCAAPPPGGGRGPRLGAGLVG